MADKKKKKHSQQVNVPADTFEQFKAIADDHFQTINGRINMLIEKDIKENGKRKSKKD